LIPPRPSPSASSDNPIKTRLAPGFTIIEVLVCLTVLALLMAIVVPTVSGLRDRARTSTTLSHLRQHGVAMTGYTSDFKGYLPAIGTPQDPTMTLSATGERIALPVFLFSVAFWNYPLLEAGYYPGRGPNDEVFFDADQYARMAEPIRLGSPAGAISFMQSCSTLAQPEYWSPFTRTDSRQWGAMRLVDVTFPSRKSLLLNIRPFYDRVRSPGGVWPTQWPPSLRFLWLLADGAGELTTIDRVRPGMFTGDGPPPVPHPSEMLPGQHTMDGIRGRDK
jgi:prepilin-type N-terminal cleavage/methylation domain-containing protein